MKILLLLTPALLFSLEPSIASEELPKKSFTYLNLGVTTTASDRFSLIMPDLSLGVRTLSSHHVFDRVVGVVAHPEVQMLYVQGSYLFFPTPSEGFYFGAGITCGLYHMKDSCPLPPTFIYANLPITLGYQFPSKKSFQFIQIQVTPLGTGTISYGIGF